MTKVKKCVQFNPEWQPLKVRQNVVQIFCIEGD